MSKLWTKPEVDMFRQMWADGHSMDECAKVLGRTYASIEKARARFGLKNRIGTSKHATRSPRYRNVGRESDAQAMMWVKLLAEARA